MSKSARQRGYDLAEAEDPTGLVELKEMVRREEAAGFANDFERGILDYIHEHENPDYTEALQELDAEFPIEAELTYPPTREEQLANRTQGWAVEVWVAALLGLLCVLSVLGII